MREPPNEITRPTHERKGIRKRDLNNYFAEGYLEDTTPEVAGNNYFVEEIRHFVTCLNEGKTPISPIDDAVTVQKMLDAIYRSAEAHAEVKI